jgi:hypothetical protein
MLPVKHGEELLVREGMILDDENTAITACFGYRLAVGASDADVARAYRPDAQFIRHHLETRERAHAGDERDVRDRLGQARPKTPLISHGFFAFLANFQ